MSDSPVYVHGLLEPDFSDPTRVVDAFVELTSPSVEEDGRELFPYEYEADGEHVEERTADVDEVKRAFATHDNGVLYRSLGELTVRMLYNMDEEHAPAPPLYTVAIDAVSFLPDEDRELFETSVHRRVSDVVELVGSAYERLRPSYVYGYGATPDYSYVSVPEREELERGHLPELYWLAIFPPELVAELGRERVLASPTWKTEELDDGAILLVVYENPRVPGDEYLPSEVRAHLEADS